MQNGYTMQESSKMNFISREKKYLVRKSSLNEAGGDHVDVILKVISS